MAYVSTALWSARELLVPSESMEVHHLISLMQL